MDDNEIDRALREWEVTRSAIERGDALWGLVAYRLARFAMELAKTDLAPLADSRREIASQLERAVGSIAANIAEGYSRATVADRRRFYAYALGSAREAITWYAALEMAPLNPGVVLARASVLARVRRLLFGMLKSSQSPRGARLFEP